jgi:hypothetical protein
MMRWLTVMVLCASLISGIAGCAKDPFSLRDPEPPSGEGGTYDTPVDPLLVASNLRFAMIEQNSANYDRTYAEMMEFSFDFLLVDRPGIGNTWGSADESRIVRNLFDGADSVAVTWTETAGQPDQFPDDSTAVLYRTYTIAVVTTDDGEAVTNTYEGDLVFHMARNTLDLWWIVRWEDRHLGEDQPAWCDLKSRYL